jgi:hypothetical protein
MKFRALSVLVLLLLGLGPGMARGEGEGKDVDLPNLYVIQVGAFRNATTAEELLGRLKSKGYAAFLEAVPGGIRRIKVVAWSFSDAKEKEKRLRSEVKGNTVVSEVKGTEALYNILLEAELSRGVDPLSALFPSEEEEEMPEEEVPEDIEMEEAIKGNPILSTAMKFLGVPYRFGGTSSRGFDCSGFVWTVFKLNGISLPRTSREQFGVGRSVSREELMPGDLVFFRNRYGRIFHVGIYISGSRFIHAASSAGRVQIADLDHYYYATRFAGGRRIEQGEIANSRSRKEVEGGG